MQGLVRSSYRHCYEEEVSKVVGADVLFTQELDDCGSENVVRVTLVNQKFHSPLGSAIERLTEAKLQIDKFGFTSDMTTSQSSISHLASNEGKRLSDNLTILINDICIAMEKLGYASYRGKVYKRDSRSTFTFSTPWPLMSFSNLGLFAK